MSIQVQRPSSSFLEDSEVEGNHYSNIDNTKKSKSLFSIASSTGKKSTLGFNQDISANKSFTGSVASATTSVYRKKITSLTGSIGPIGLGHFAGWSRKELIDLLIANEIELRGERFLPMDTLRQLAETVTEGDATTPMKIMPYPVEVLQNREKAAKTIQRNWIIYHERDMLDNMTLNGSYQNLVSSSVGNLPPPENESYYRALHNSMRSHQLEFSQLESIFENEQYETTGPAATAATTADSGDSRSKLSSPDNSVSPGGPSPNPNPGGGAVLATSNSSNSEKGTGRIGKEEEWSPPDFPYARMLASYNHPRKGGLGGTPFPVLKTSMGRHCFRSGWGEQCNLWGEGSISEMTPFGPGITNYFKFIKWCFWIFFMLVLINLPILVLNIYGPSESYSSTLMDLSTTTVGNLGGLNGTISISIPGCNKEEYHQNCNITSQNIALLYSILDVTGCIVLLVGFIWLRIFEKRESNILDRHTVAASDYTVEVKNLPHDKKFKDVELKIHFAKITGHAVASVSIAYDNEEDIEIFRKRGKLIKQRYHISQKYRYNCTAVKDRVVTHQYLKNIKEQYEKVTKDIKDIDKTMKEREDKLTPIMAFVTFEEQFGAHVAVRMYNRSIFGFHFMPSHLRFKESRLRVSLAPEPSTIIWENLRYTSFQRDSRRFLTNLIAIGLLAVSFGATFFTRMQNQVASSIGGDSACPNDWSSYSTDEQQAAVTSDSSILHCYCDARSYYDQGQDSLCTHYIKAKILSNTYIVLATGIVLAVNHFLESVIRAFAVYEKHHSLDSLEGSIFWRLFLLKFLNTGCSFLFTNSFILKTTHSSVFQGIYAVAYRPQNVFTTSWFDDVAVSIVLVQFGDMIFPHIPKFLRYWKMQRDIKMAETGKTVILTQSELNELYLGPDYMLSHRFAQLLTTFFVCFMYSTGIPLLTILATANFGLAYWVEKYLIIRFYKSPPRFRYKIGRQASYLILFAVVVHVTVSIWILNQESNFPKYYLIDKSYRDYVNSYDPINAHAALVKVHVLILFILGVVVLASIVLDFFLSYLFGGLSKVVKYFCGSLANSSRFISEMERFLSAEASVTYTRALQRGLIKGLANYNILHNPKYKADFAISDRFALMHSHVSSVRKFTDDGNDDAYEVEKFRHKVDPTQMKLLRAQDKLHGEGIINKPMLSGGSGSGQYRKNMKKGKLPHNPSHNRTPSHEQRMLRNIKEGDEIGEYKKDGRRNAPPKLRSASPVPPASASSVNRKDRFDDNSKRPAQRLNTTGDAELFRHVRNHSNASASGGSSNPGSSGSGSEADQKNPSLPDKKNNKKQQSDVTAYGNPATVKKIQSLLNASTDSNSPKNSSPHSTGSAAGSIYSPAHPFSPLSASTPSGPSPLTTAAPDSPMSPQATLQNTYDSLGSPFIRPNPMHQAGPSVAASSSRPDRPPNNRRQETDVGDEDKSATLENKRLKLHREKMIQKEKELKEKELKEKKLKEKEMI